MPCASHATGSSPLQKGQSHHWASQLRAFIALHARLPHKTTTTTGGEDRAPPCEGHQVDRPQAIHLAAGTARAAQAPALQRILLASQPAQPPVRLLLQGFAIDPEAAGSSRSMPFGPTLAMFMAIFIDFPWFFNVLHGFQKRFRPLAASDAPCRGAARSSRHLPSHTAEPPPHSASALDLGQLHVRHVFEVSAFKNASKSAKKSPKTRRNKGQTGPGTLVEQSHREAWQL